MPNTEKLTETKIIEAKDEILAELLANAKTDNERSGYRTWNSHVSTIEKIVSEVTHKLSQEGYNMTGQSADYQLVLKTLVAQPTVIDETKY